MEPETERLTDDELERMRKERFAARVQRVLAVMKQESVDWRGVAFITPDGRIGTYVVPVEMGPSPARSAGPGGGDEREPA